MKFSMEPPRLSDSTIGALINGAINGAIAWAAFKTSESIPLSMDSIATPGVTAFGNATTVAFALTLIMTCITFVAIAVLWQRFVGTVMVGPLAATRVVAAVATVATAIAEWRTKREMLAVSASTY